MKLEYWVLVVVLGLAAVYGFFTNIDLLDRAKAMSEPAKQEDQTKTDN